MLEQGSETPAGGEDGAAAPAIERHTPAFEGRAGEYFGIWIVNVLLSILTLGIYSAWAKVRTERYFYGNTRLAGATFEYLADPLRILKGRLIAYAVVIALGLSSHFLPILYVLLLLALFAVMPLIVFLATRFRAHYSAWRGLRFGFVGRAGEAYGPFMGWPLAAMATAGLLYPLMAHRQHEYLARGHRFGTAEFGFDAESGPYFPPFVIAAVAGIGLFVLYFALVLGAVVSAGPGAEAGAGVPGSVMASLMIGVTVLYVGMFVIMVFLRTRYTNLFWNNTRLGPHRFESRLRFRDMLWLYASNLVVLLCTLGLATPWAMVRLARYRAQCFTLVACGDIGEFAAALDADRGAAGAELVDALDLGVDIGI